MEEGPNLLGQTFQCLKVRDDFALQVFTTQDFAAPNRVGFQVMPNLFIGVEFRTIRRQEKELELNAVALLALLDEG